ncbi:digestive cysteine proteinase 1-like isoform X1 [Dreissena polymorpha]|uniref:digestive cysteine proteinase 1-like isoform X1 n=1 Tax=Dreissena polymorpha TaxID=45954 RepID=UPI002263F475|nr:digestive cysteine proteinase 1-like isoform X1 [Dreissena polymorpha]
MANAVRMYYSALFIFGAVCALPQEMLQVKVMDQPPTWGNVYSVQGNLQLPYAEIQEPFAGFYDAPNKRSRIDYYGGMVQTMQRADMFMYGSSYKIAPLTTYQQRNVMSCFQVNGTSGSTVDIQNVLPDLSGFQKQSLQDIVDGRACDVWVLVDQQGHKKNTYTMWVDPSDNSPVRYIMMGFDSLLGSHYDKYVIDYSQYNTAPIPASTFDPPQGMTCGGFPGPGSGEHRVLSNPIMEYVSHHDNHITEMFDQFKSKHGKVYGHEKEHAQRMHNFRQNVRFIHSKNRQGLTYRLAVNHLTDLSRAELKMRNGYRHTPGDHGAQVFDKSKVNRASVPDTIDWRILGAVTQVKDQGVCGSCWSFGTVGTIEGAYFLKTGYRVRFSQQQLIDCSWGEGNNGCDGGEDFRSYNYIMKVGGLTSEEQYGQYLAQDAYCHDDKVSSIVQLSGYTNVTAYDQEALAFAIATKGPVSVAIDASHLSLSFYADGVYYEPACGSGPDDLDHAVLAVGYGTLNGEKYWLVKNSWSTYWGNDGYVLMSQKDNNCGVATAPTFVTLV